MRDYASAKELLILSALQALNERLLKWGCDKEQRFDLLTEATSDWRSILNKKKSIQTLTDRIDRQKRLKRQVFITAKNLQVCITAKNTTFEREASRT